MRAVILNCTLKQTPEPSNTQVLAEVVGDALKERDVEVRSFRVVDHVVPPGVLTDIGDNTDRWPRLHERYFLGQSTTEPQGTVGRTSDIDCSTSH